MDSSNQQSETNACQSVGTYLSWTRVITGKKEVQILNCYLEPGNEPFKTERAKRITDIIKDIIKQDVDAAIVVCGDFNNHINHIYRELNTLQFKHAID